MKLPAPAFFIGRDLKRIFTLDDGNAEAIPVFTSVTKADKYRRHVSKKFSIGLQTRICKDFSSMLHIFEAISVVKHDAVVMIDPVIDEKNRCYSLGQVLEYLQSKNRTPPNRKGNKNHLPHNE